MMTAPTAAPTSGSQTPRPPRPPRPTRAELAHIPSTGDWPLVSEARFLSNTLAFAQRVHAKCGPVSRGWWMFGQSVYLMSAQANEAVLFDRAGRFSAKLGWERVLAELFPRGLMLRDAEDHRWHRRLMLPAFRKEALARYLAVMTPRAEAAVAQWGLSATQAGQATQASSGGSSGALSPNFQFYPAIKRLTLAIAAEVFLGVVLDAEIDQISKDFTDLVGASVAVVRIPVIGRTYARGVQGRARLAAFIRARIPQRRAGTGDDLFTQLCHARDEDDKQYSDDEIVDHLIFLMMAAHDTTTSAITTLVYALAKHPAWQDRLRREAQGLSNTLRQASTASEPGAQPAPKLDDLATMTDIDLVFKEALRLYQPLPTIARRALVAFEIHGQKIPAGAAVAVFPIQVHRSPEWWTDPETFDPERFAPERAEHRRHPYAWAPFGGGAHMCLGLHFAEMQVKAILLPLLRDWTWQVPADYAPDYAYAPIAKPRDGLMIRLGKV